VGLTLGETEAFKEHYRRGYADQLIFLNGRILKAIDSIVSKYSPDNRPVIILQGDHGPGLRVNTQSHNHEFVWERTGILNAYLLPQGSAFDVRSDITPANTFRVVFNGLFDAGLPMLPDKTLHSTYAAPWNCDELLEEQMRPPEGYAEQPEIQPGLLRAGGD
jgi:hypothetical protein